MIKALSLRIEGATAPSRSAEMCHTTSEKCAWADIEIHL